MHGAAKKTVQLVQCAAAGGAAVEGSDLPGAAGRRMALSKTSRHYAWVCRLGALMGAGGG